ncbi:phytochrome-like protein cph1 [bacterium BMS3Abin10]|nr:phytochrome-like protein cph1 [bacterium BMS3Abin10]
MKIIYKLIGGFLAVSLLICLTGYLAVNASKKIMQSVFTDNVSNMALRIMDEIDRDMNYKIETIRAYSADPDLHETVTRSNQDFEKLDDIQAYINNKDREWVSAAKDEVTPFMRDLIDSNLSGELRGKLDFYRKKYGYRVFGEVFVTNKYGANVAQTNKTSDYRQDDEEWWQKAKAQGLYVTDVGYDESSKVYSTNIGLRIDDNNGNFIGVIKAVLNIEEIINIIKDMKAYGMHKKHVYMEYMLITKGGKIIYSTRESKKLSDDISTLFVHDSQDEPKGEFIDSEQGKILRVYVHSTGFRDFKGLDWVLIIDHYSEEIFAPVSRLKNRILFSSLIVTTFAILLGAIISRSIARPVSILRDAANKIGKGDLDTRIEVRTKDEIGQLAHSFRQMTADLKKTTTSVHELNREIAERKKWEKALIRSNEFSRVILDSMGDAISIIDVSNFRILECNEAFLKEAGLEKEKVIGKTCYEVTHNRSKPCASADIMCPLSDSLLTGEKSTSEHLHYTRHSGSIFAEISTFPIKDESGKIVQVVHVSKDITVRKKAEEELKTFKFISDYSNEGQYLVDRKGRFLYVNDAACKMLQYSRDELLELGISHVDARYDETRYRTLFDLVQTEKVAPFETINRRKDGTTYPVDISVTAIKVNGKPYLFAVTRDISERKKAEEALAGRTEELTRSNAELQQFAYVASHDLQEPLRMVSSYVQLLGRKYKGRLDKDADEFIHFAVDGAERMQRLINDLLAYSRVDTRGKPFESANCEAVLRQVLMYMQETVRENNAEVTYESLPEVMADSVQIARLFQNLISNAIKFHGKDHPRVHVSARQENDNWVFSVKDNGIGIEQKFKDRIFQIFQRLHPRSEYSGTGIGLAVCKKIVERHGGRIWVESEPGKGSTFYFTIPVKKEVTPLDSAPTVSRQAKLDGGVKKRIWTTG